MLLINTNFTRPTIDPYIDEYYLNKLKRPALMPAALSYFSRLSVVKFALLD